MARDIALDYPAARPATPVAREDVLPSSPLPPSSPPPPQSPAAATPTSRLVVPRLPRSTPAAATPSNAFHPSTPDTPVTPTRTRPTSAAGRGPLHPSTPDTPTPKATKRRRQTSDEADEEEAKQPHNPFPEPPPLTHPTSYLYRRCPACFGDLKHDPSQAVDIQVCGDGCFTHKRRHNTGGRDPCRTHPDTVFVPESIANEMAAHVESIRPPKPKPGKQQRMEEEPDGYDPGLKFVQSRDENREKASTKFFEDTGLMGLLCRHDRVLFLVNMRSAGEKQYYMLALLEMLFQHLPSNIRVGLLYDIACLLHQSCVSTNSWIATWTVSYSVSRCSTLLATVALSINLPSLKCLGFGFTNREGCERFWHAISNLIAYLRYHRRLFTLDLQIEHDDQASLGRLGAWLLRRTIHCEEKLREANADLEACGITVAVLRAHWKEQVDVQTRPLKRQAKTHGAAAVDRILEARKLSETAFGRVTFLEETMANPASEDHERVYADLHIAEARKAWQTAKEKAKRLERELGITDATAVKKLAHSGYYTARMNAKVVKERLLSKLRDRKFERDPIERKLVKTYNKLCDDISNFIKSKKAPKGAVAPPPIPEKGLYQLDVDDMIWQDVGLDDADGPPPPWLVDDKVRSGIRAMLQRDRCFEEAPRLVRERRHLQVWFATEWKVVSDLVETCEEEELLELFVLWKKSLDRIAFDNTDVPPWGPTPDEVRACQISNVTASWNVADSGEDSDRIESEDEEEEDDVFQIVEAVERADNHRAGDEDGDFWV
ncbi:hypothetical protein K438DRAFT_2130094 [Mycena galopus ATCC 62051]|nr:hypothetical protein K438DRAFT_2130094 [Mycena galopus ATCC 62051]